MITGIITTSILQSKAEKRNQKNIAKAPYDIQITVYRQTLSDLESYLDTSDLLKLTATSLKVIRDDFFEIIKGVRALKKKIPKGYVKSLDGTLEELRLARDTIQASFDLFDPSGQIKKNKSKPLLAEMRLARKHIEKALGMLSYNR